MDEWTNIWTVRYILVQMTIQPDSNAPYAPPQAVMEVLAQDRKRGIPTPVTTDVIERIGVSPALAHRTLQAFRLLDLIDEEGMPTEAMTALRKAPQDEYKTKLAEVLRSAYAPVFQYVDPREDGIDRVRDQFRHFTPTGMQERMVTLFLGLCAEAGIIDEAPRRRGRPPKIGINAKATVSGTTKQTTPRRRNPETATIPPTTEKPATEKPTIGSKPVGAEPLIVGLIEQLPEPGAVFPDASRNEWVQALQAIFNLIYVRPDSDSIPTVRTTAKDGG